MSEMYRNYLISTASYGAVAIVTAILAYVTFMQTRLLVSMILILACGVAIDNFFCGDRCRNAGGLAEGHYTVPFRRKHAPKVAAVGKSVKVRRK